MNYHGLLKSLDLPAGWVPPTDLVYDDVRACAISRAGSNGIPFTKACYFNTEIPDVPR
jgi:hypothetical protein